MKKSFFLVLLVAIFSFSFVERNKINVAVNFYNDQNISFTKGTLTVLDTGEKFEINNLETLNIPLKKGKHQFHFESETPNYIVAPKKITIVTNQVSVFLSEKITNKDNSEINSNDSIEKSEALKKPIATFIMFGIMSHNNKKFTEKYNVDFKYENCVITGYLSKKAKKNNQRIAKILTEKYGDTWKKDLGFEPYGLETK